MDKPPYFRLLFISIERGVNRTSAESSANLSGILSKAFLLPVF